jgi:hypothetical protein
MHPIPKLRESGRATAEQFAALPDENVVMHSPLLSKAILSRDAVAKTMAASSRNRDYGDYALERKLDDDTALLRWKGTIDGHGFRVGSTASSRSVPSPIAHSPHSEFFETDNALQLVTACLPTRGTTF